MGKLVAMLKEKTLYASLKQGSKRKSKWRKWNIFVQRGSQKTQIPTNVSTRLRIVEKKKSVAEIMGVLNVVSPWDRHCDSGEKKFGYQTFYKKEENSEGEGAHNLSALDENLTAMKNEIN